MQLNIWCLNSCCDSSSCLNPDAHFEEGFYGRVMEGEFYCLKLQACLLLVWWTFFLHHVFGLEPVRSSDKIKENHTGCLWLLVFDLFCSWIFEGANMSQWKMPLRPLDRLAIGSCHEAEAPFYPTEFITFMSTQPAVLITLWFSWLKTRWASARIVSEFAGSLH